MDEFFAGNRANWDERVAIHLRDTTGLYGLDATRSGQDVLGPIEAAEIGDITGKRLLHSQCHFGLDTISLSRRGAQATGLDFSPMAIEAARALADEVGVDIDFVEGHVYDAAEVAGTGYDIVFTTWGTIGWLSSISRCAEAISDCLSPGGFLYLADGHPILDMITERDDRLDFAFDWRTPQDAPIIETVEQSYAVDGTRIDNNRTYTWNHPLSDIIGALSERGLRLEFLHEHEAIPWQAFPSMVATGDRMFVQQPGQTKLPLAFSLKAVKI